MKIGLIFWFVLTVASAFAGPGPVGLGACDLHLRDLTALPSSRVSFSLSGVAAGGEAFWGKGSVETNRAAGLSNWEFQSFEVATETHSLTYYPIPNLWVQVGHPGRLSLDKDRKSMTERMRLLPETTPTKTAIRSAIKRMDVDAYFAAASRQNQASLVMFDSSGWFQSPDDQGHGVHLNLFHQQGISSNILQRIIKPGHQELNLLAFNLDAAKFIPRAPVQLRCMLAIGEPDVEGDIIFDKGFVRAVRLGSSAFRAGVRVRMRREEAAAAIKGWHRDKAAQKNEWLVCETYLSKWNQP